MNKKKEAFLHHELKILHKCNKEIKEKEEKKNKIKKEKSKEKSNKLSKVLISFLKSKKDLGFTCNSLKKEINLKVRLNVIKDELEKLCSKKILTSFEGFRKYKHYQWNQEFDSKKEIETEIVKEIITVKNDEELTEEENNSDIGEEDHELFYDIPATYSN